MEKIILASRSPRRKRILNQIGIPFSVQPVDIDETHCGMSAENHVTALAVRKVKAILDSAKPPPLWILGADTVIDYQGKIIGKPESLEKAEEILISLSGNKHFVFTGLAFYTPENKIITDYAVTEVYFSTMTKTDIQWYLSTGEWKDAAGGYQIQQKGSCFIKRINGSYSNVEGLPINTFYGMLKKHNYPYL